jgi:hypothetical protein
MFTMSASESNIYLAELIAEMLAMHSLPADLRQALNAHLSKQFSLVNILKPEYCRRLYPILVELAESQAYSEITASVVVNEVTAPLEINVAYSPDSIYEAEEDEEADAL